MPFHKTYLQLRKLFLHGTWVEIENEREVYVGLVSLLTAESCLGHESLGCPQILYPGLFVVGYSTLININHLQIHYQYFHHSKGILILGHT
jgi:hypothetical protein